jgi:hypothetical protein
VIARAKAQTSRPENTWLKATTDADSLHSVQYAYRSAMKEDLIGAISYLHDVSVCDKRHIDRPCPAGM